MAMAFTPLSWWLWSGKQREPKITNGSSLNSSPDVGLLELDSLKFPLVRGGNMASTSRREKRKWTSRKEQKIDREHDVVVVPSDGGCVSGSDSDDSDWSIGWLEPHGPGFQDDNDSDDSFAVLVPCYGRCCEDVEENPKDKFLDTIPDIYAAGSAADGRILRDALIRQYPLIVPNGKYFLVDAGYTNCSGFLAPYRGTRYHLNEWATCGNNPRIYK